MHCLKCFFNSEIETPVVWVVLAGNVEAYGGFGLMDAGTKSDAIADFGRSPMPIVIVVNITYWGKYGTFEESPNRDAQFGL